MVLENYPEYFAEIESPAGFKTDSSSHDVSFRTERGTCSAASKDVYSACVDSREANPSPSLEHKQAGRVMDASVRDDPSVGTRLSSAARNEMKTVETEIKYAGYLDQQRKSIERLKRAEQRVIPEWFDYGKVSGLSREMNEKLQRVRPRTLGHASRIPGVTPAAVSLINVYIEIQAKHFAQAQQTAG